MKTSQSGMALLISLWALALLSLVMAAVVSAVRSENRLSLHALHQARAELAAEAGLALALEQSWTADGTAHVLGFDQARLTLRLSSERGKLDLNSADPALVRRMALAFGAAPANASALAAALAQRQADAAETPLRTLEEATQLAGMDAALYTRLAPYLTVWTGQERPLGALAEAPLRQALNLDDDGSLEADPVLGVESTAVMPDGARSTLRATVLMAPRQNPPYRILRWQP